MKKVSMMFLLAGLLAISACDEAPKSKMENPLAGHAKALEKAKDVERQLLEADKNQRKAIDAMSN